METTQIYKVLVKNITVQGQDWKVQYYDVHDTVIFDNNSNLDISNKINFVINNSYKLPFRFSFESKIIQFTCGICPTNKIIYVGTKQLGYELSVIRWYDFLKKPEVIFDVENHAKKIASIPVENAPSIIDQITFDQKLVNFNDSKYDDIHTKSLKLSVELISKVSTYKQSLFERFSDFGLDLTANYKLIRIHLLKFLAILPSLDHEISGVEVKRIFLESMTRLLIDSNKAKDKRLKGQNKCLPSSYTVAVQVLISISRLVPPKALAYIIRTLVSVMAKRFIAGENIKLAHGSLKGLINSNRDATLDQLGELVVSKKEANEYERKVVEIIQGMSQHIKPGSRNKAGINQAHVSIKISALTHDFRPHSFDSTYKSIAPRLINILLEAKKHKVFINIDAEHYHFRDIVLDIYEKVLIDTVELHEFKDTGIVIQAYLRDGHKHFEDVLAVAKKRNLLMPIRLVKGAYWDVETVEAKAHNFEAPEFLNKEETDIHFRQIVSMVLENGEFIQLAVASHNIQDHCFAETLRSELYPNAPIIEHQCLHMTYEALSHGLSLMDWPTRNYIPVGDLIVGMAYLVRRIMENSSQVGILTIMRSHKKKSEPKTPSEIMVEKFNNKEIVYDDSILKLRREFINIYPIRTYLPEQFIRIENNLKEYHKDLKENDFSVNDNEEIIIASSDETLQLGKVKLDTLDKVNEKIDILFDGYQNTSWKNQDSDRHLALLKLSELLLINRESLTSLIIFEAGKTLDEAIADVDEAIDFIQFYIKEFFYITMNHTAYSSKGVFGIIAPWNFPLAIPVGMTVSALVTGNTVLLKPAEQTPLISLEFLRLARVAGIDESVFDIALGAGDIGAAIVDHELISGVVFTGSREVGTMIYQKLKQQHTSERYSFKPVSKTVITEMGGKNAIIVTNNCELDETVSGVIYSTFAHSGQKCSAASRVIIDEKVKESFINRFIAAVGDVKVGVSYDHETSINPLVSKEDQVRVRKMVKLAVEEAQSTEGSVLLDNSNVDYPGFCVGATVIELKMSQALKKESIAQQEIFGPVLHIVSYKDLDEALELFNSTDFALTGGIYCQSQDDIDYLSEKMECGNIYINRPNTGARVAIEPFGGFKMSGTGPKAGSVDYLYSFMRIEDSKELVIIDIDDSFTDDVQFATSSKLSIEKRQERSLEFVDRIINRFEVFFGEINEEQKEYLVELLEYLGKRENFLNTKEFLNRVIPGQLNFDKRDLNLGTGNVFLGNGQITFSTLIEIVINLYIGNGLNLLCANETSFNTWNPIVDLAYNVGFSPYNITCGKFNNDSLQKILERDDYKFVIIDKDLDFEKLVLSKLFLSSNEKSDYLIKAFITGADVNLGSWEQYIKLYTIPRAFAVNTMRHGAPLEFDF
jgi:RHH-type proline utilization regulon transcriptional repressor/proline dehydrogenase/delta 1-pyrroline-5-carboxylate dehydrogenase